MADKMNQKQQKAYSAALKKINSAASDDQPDLNLIGMGLSQLPPEIGELINLQWLYLGNNQLSQLPKEITQLKNLQRLDLRGNRLSQLPKEITQLKNLQRLDLDGNQLSQLPKEITQLINLQRLGLSHNQLSQLPKEITQLINLQMLGLGNNQLSQLPDWITELDMETVWIGFSFGSGIYLYGNPLEEPPVEIVEQGKKAIRNYFEERKKGDDYLYEAKLLIVGEERAGKTMLSLALSRDDFDFEQAKEKIESTEGIEITAWQIPRCETKFPKDFRFHIWDFGGQMIYHATHQFFLSKRSVYLLVTEARNEMRHEDYYYWLNIIELLGDNSPTVLVLNKCDLPSVFPPVQEYQSSFGFINDSLEVSCINEYRDKITSLKEALIRILKNKNLMPHIGKPLPKAWVMIRNDLEDIRQRKKKYISYQQYLDICELRGLDEQKAESLSEYFHDLGAILHFRDDLLLRNTVFLDYDWVTEAVYNVLDNRNVKQQLGEFTNDDLKSIWTAPEHSGKEAELLELMKHDKFELCYQIDSNRYMAPQLLPPDRPKCMEGYERTFSQPLCYDFKYKFMPKGILTRLIVRLRRYVKKEKCWRYGMVVEYDNSRALVREMYFDRKISILVEGECKKDLLCIIQYNIRDINESFRQKVEEMVPCNCDECTKSCNEGKEPHYFKLSDLQRRLDNNKNEIECEKSYDKRGIYELLGVSVIYIEEPISGKREIHYHHHDGGHVMKIGKQYITGEKAKVINADEVEYYEQSGLTKDQLQTVLKAVEKLMEKERELLKEYYQQLDKLESQSDKENISRKIRTFLVNSGIAIAQNLTASGIYDLGKNLFS